MTTESERPEALTTIAQVPETRVLRIGIASPQQMRARTIAIARGALKPGPDDPKIWVPSFEALGRLMTEQNTALLARIRASRPASIKDLSRIVERKPSNLLRTLRAMEKHGLVRLRRDRGRALQPEVPFDRIEVGVELPPVAA
ncbi:MarR family transcriptional regulator [Methylobacterium hispanicum]|uniref:HVO_A0114 family putative DNA-binding protein n=1 Tax=Methylobacterium hispanicum TaxID=270350 RepID=UPI002F302623